MLVNALRTSLSLALLLAGVLCASANEIVQETGMSDSASSNGNSVHLTKKRSALEPSPSDVGDDEALLLGADTAYLPEDDGEGNPWDADKRSSLFRFGKRQFRYGKRQFRYGKRQFRYGKRSSLFRFGKRSGGTLFRFGKRAGPSPAEEAQRQELARIALEDLLSRQAANYESDSGPAKREMNGFHWGNDF